MTQDKKNEISFPQSNAKKEVIKHSAAIHIKNSINLLARRTWNILLANAFHELKTKSEHKINVADLQRVLGFDSKNDKYLKHSIESLVGCVVTWNVLGKDKKQAWCASGLLSDAEIKDGLCTYSYSDPLRKKLVNPSMYTRISLILQNRFTSKHALALYELCLDYLDLRRGMGETAIMSIDAYRHLMGLKNSQYPSFKVLNEFVIKTSVREVNEVSDLDVKAQFFRDGRKVASLKFIIRKKMSFQLSLPAATTEDAQEKGETDSSDEANPNLENLFQLLRKKTQLLKTVLTSALAKKGFEYVQASILYANENAKKNYSLFLRRTLENDWAREKREENVFDAQETQQRETEGMISYVEKFAAEQASRGLPERLANLPAKNRKNYLVQARERILASKHREYLLQAENSAFLEKAIQMEAIRAMESGESPNADNLSFRNPA